MILGISIIHKTQWKVGAETWHSLTFFRLVAVCSVNLNTRQDACLTRKTKQLGNFGGWKVGISKGNNMLCTIMFHTPIRQE